jgi:hypothetical protein
MYLANAPKYIQYFGIKLFSSQLLKRTLLKKLREGELFDQNYPGANCCSAQKFKTKYLCI